ncbi:MAG: hypothetical protein ABIF77_20840, partial [bacterium]
SYPGNEFPKRGYVEAHEYSRRYLRNKAFEDTTGANPPWRELGPHNVGGRTLALAFNPQNPRTIYAGSASGGLWRSYSAGVGATAWHQVPTGHPVLGVAAIAIAPDDSNVMYIGTGEVYSHTNTQGGITVRLTRGSFGIGLLKTIDGGLTWFKSLDWSYDQGTGIQVVRLDPINPDIVWVGATAGIYKSTDAGGSWSRKSSVAMCTDLVIHTENPDIMVAAHGSLSKPDSGVGLYRSADGGESWHKIVAHTAIPSSYNGKALLSICRADPDVIMASIGNGTEVPDGTVDNNATWLVRSEDAGLTWSLVSEEDYSRWQGWFSHDVAIHPLHPDTVITSGIDIYRSLTGGVNLERRSFSGRAQGRQVQPGEQEASPDFSHADHHDIVFHPTDHDTVYFASDGGVYRSLNCGETFESCNGGYQTTQFYAGFSSSQQDSNHALGGLQDNGTVMYDGTDAWLRISGGDGSWTAIDPRDDDTIYASYQNLVIRKSLDRGENWVNITPPDVPGTIGFIAPYVLGGAQQPDVIYAASSHILKSEDGGSSWDIVNFNLQFDGNPAVALAVSPADPDVVAATTAPVFGPAGVFISTNAGSRFSEITGDLPDRYPVGLAFDPLDSHTLYVTFSGFGTSHLFRTTDSGETWEDLGQELPDIPTNAVIVDPDFTDQIYVGTDFGVYVSTNNGVTWNEFFAGMPEAAVCMDLTISPVNRMLRVSTYGNGVYERPLLPEIEDEDPDPDTPPGPNVVVLSQNEPNPFNPGTDFVYTLGSDGHVKMEVFTVRGERVATVIDGFELAGVDKRKSWDGTTDSGRRLPGGVYLYRLEALGKSEVRKMVIVRYGRG